MRLKAEPGHFSFFDSKQKLIGEITFTSISPTCISIDHTFVHPNYRNQGIARQLLQFVLQLAKQKHWQIVPVCPYAKKVLQSEIQLHPFLKNSINNRRNSKNDPK